MKKRHITLLLAFVLCFSLFAVGVSAVSYNGTATPLMETTTGEYGKLIWKQDFEDAASVGDYRYNIGYVSPYAADGASLSDPSLVWTGDGDGTNPTFTIVDNPVGDGKVLSMLGKTTYPDLPPELRQRKRHHFQARQIHACGSCLRRRKRLCC